MYLQLPHADLFGCHAIFNNDKWKGMHMLLEPLKARRGTEAATHHLCVSLPAWHQSERVLLWLLSSLCAFCICGE